MYRLYPALIVLTLITLSVNAQERFVFSEPKMGSPFNIIMYDQDSQHATAIASNAFHLVDSLVNIFSNYIDSSELNKLSRSAGSGSFIRLSPVLYDILLESQIAYKRSGHSFDITVGPLTDIWRAARKQNKFPDSSVIREIKKRTGFRNIRIRRGDQSASLRKKNMRLDLGGIAQGYIAEKVLASIRNAGINAVLVDVSGDIAMGDAPPGKKGWVVGVNLPDRADELMDKKLLLRNMTVSTSGDVYQYILHAGKKYSHIIDPRTGYGVTEGRNVTVIAKNATRADWLATACSILPLAKAKKLARKMNAEIMMVYYKEGKLVIDETKGFAKYRQ